MKELNFFKIKSGKLYGAEYQRWNDKTNTIDEGRGDALWIIAGYDEFYKIRPNYDEDAIMVHWYEEESGVLHLNYTIGENVWLMHGYEDMEFGHFDSNYGEFWKMALIDHLFVAKKVNGKI